MSDDTAYYRALANLLSPLLSDPEEPIPASVARAIERLKENQQKSQEKDHDDD